MESLLLDIGLTTPVGWLLLLQLTVLSRSAIVVKSKFLVAFFMLSCYFLEFSVSVGAFGIGLSQISSFFSYTHVDQSLITLFVF